MKYRIMTRICLVWSQSDGPTTSCWLVPGSQVRLLVRVYEHTSNWPIGASTGSQDHVPRDDILELPQHHRGPSRTTHLTQPTVVYLAHPSRIQTTTLDDLRKLSGYNYGNYRRGSDFFFIRTLVNKPSTSFTFAPSRVFLGHYIHALPNTQILCKISNLVSFIVSSFIPSILSSPSRSFPRANT
jgi:hypothetical protein